MERATYTPIKQPVPRSRGRAWDKWAFTALLAPKLKELDRMTYAINNTPQRDLLQTIETIRTALQSSTTPNKEYIGFESVSHFSELSPAALIHFSDALIQLRKFSLQASVAAVNQLQHAYDSQTEITQTLAQNPTDTQTLPVSSWRRVGTAAIPGLPEATLFKAQNSLPAPSAKRMTNKSRSKPRVRITSTDLHSIGYQLVPQLPALSESRARVQTIVPNINRMQELTLNDLVQWGSRKNELKEAAQLMSETANLFSLSLDTLTPRNLELVIPIIISNFEKMKESFRQKMEMEPVGFLHLERLTFTPMSIEKGELVYSVPLSPAEEVNIAHKEWSNTSDEFDKIVTDYLEEYSEEGVSEKTELTQSTQSQDQHSSGFNTGVTASGGYGPVTITASVGYNVADSASHSEQSARNQSSNLTKKASTRSKKEHKMSFKVASARGTTDEAVRKIRNPFTDKATRVDYYQLIRKWQVGLYRYGVRLTYDFTIPEPGSDILSRIIEMNSLRKTLEQGFNSPTSELPWAKFDLKPGNIQRDNYMDLAAKYGSSIDVPPPETKSAMKSFSKSWPNEDATEHGEYSTMQFDIPEYYVITGASYTSQAWKYDDEDWHFEARTDVNQWLGKDNKVEFVVSTKYVSSFNFDFVFTFTLKPEVFENWQMKVWTSLKDAAEAQYEEYRTLLKDRLSQLQLEIGNQDPLSLRKIEREEVMKGVLRWLFGPSFSFVPPSQPANLYDKDQTVANNSVWGTVLKHGQIIQFLHHAIEWENMLYFLYPYFWSHTSRWDLKKYLDHPDIMHKVFLKSGSARVVLTIRPGFEKEFVSFLETGKMDGLTDGHPYLSIAEEIENYSKTNYPGLAPANPVENARPLLYPEQKKAWEDMQKIILLLEDYKKSKGAYPTTSEGLDVLKSLGSFSPTDPWGNPYQYTSPGILREYELVSYGANSKSGGDGIDADIQSWAEASLIGQWNEYTPTSALDISFNEILPSA